MLAAPFFNGVLLTPTAACTQMNSVVYVGDGRSREVLRAFEFPGPPGNRSRPIAFEVLITTFELVLKVRRALGGSLFRMWPDSDGPHDEHPAGVLRGVAEQGRPLRSPPCTPSIETAPARSSGSCILPPHLGMLGLSGRRAAVQGSVVVPAGRRGPPTEEQRQRTVPGGCWMFQ